MDKLVHLLQHPPFPGALLGNLLALASWPGHEQPGLAEHILSDHAAAVAKHVPKVCEPRSRASGVGQAPI